MRLKILAILMLSIGCIVFLPTLSRAIPLPIGDPIPGNSWSQAWQENSYYNGEYHSFDKFEAFIMTGPTDFESTGLTNLSSGFSALLINPDYSVATGPDFSVGTLFYFTTAFSGSLYDGFAFDVVLWVDGTIHGAQHTVYSNGGWVFTELDITKLPNYNRTPVPEPGILILLGIAMVSVAAARRKFKG